MKPARFVYTRPSSVAEVCALLAEHGDEARILAGGQSLGPLMNLRLATPAVLVDINRIGGVDRIEDGLEGVTLAALVRQRGAEHSSLVQREVPLLAEAIGWVGHIGVRNRGTVAGSIAHADPAAELPAVLVALEGSVRATSATGARMISAADLFTAYFTTTLRPDEWITSVVVPRLPPRTGHAWLEFARRHGDYAIVGVAAVVTLDERGACTRVRVVCTGIDEVPYDASAAAVELEGSPISGEGSAEVAQRVASECSPGSDALVDAAFRRHLVRHLVSRSLEAAGHRAHREVAGGR
jgi:carbon-monoxide dehydrogenase medium subunit